MAASAPAVVDSEIKKLCDAVKNREIAIVTSIVQSNPELVNAKDENGMTAFHWACKFRQDSPFEEFKDKLARVSDRQKIFEILLQNGADVDTETNDGNYALSIVLGSFAHFLKRFTLNHKSEIDSLHAITNSYVGVVAMLRQRGAKVKHNPDYEIILNRIFLDATACGYWDIVDECLTPTGNISLFCCILAFKNACEFGRLNIVRYLINLKAEMVASGLSNGFIKEDINTALLLASSNGHLDVIKELMNRKFLSGLDPKDENGSTPLLLAINNGHLEVVKFLLENGADFNAEDVVHFGVLLFACKSGNLDLFRFIWEKMPIKDINVRTEYGMTPLSTASYHDQPKLVEILLDMGAKINIEGDGYENALLGACLNNNLQIVKLLLAKLEPEAMDAVISKLLFYMCAKGGYGEVAIIEELFKKCSKVEIDYMALIKVAKDSRMFEVVNYLKDLVVRRGVIHFSMLLSDFFPEAFKDDNEPIPEHICKTGMLPNILRGDLDLEVKKPAP